MNLTPLEPRQTRYINDRFMTTFMRFVSDPDIQRIRVADPWNELHRSFRRGLFMLTYDWRWFFGGRGEAFDE